MKKYRLLLLLFALSLNILAQQPDSTLLFTSTAGEQLFSVQNSTQRTDTALDNTHNYYQMGVLGNIGLPSYSLLAKDNSYTSGFFRWTDLGNNRNDLFTDKDALYFKPSGKVYTKIFAAMGQKQEQVFKVVHSQNIKKVNVSLLFNRYSCFGFYAFQKTITDNLLVSSNYTTKNGRWGYNTHLIYNKLKYQLNGGIRDDSLLALNPFVDKQLLPVNLTTARQNVKTSSFLFSTFFRLNKRDSARSSHFILYEGNYQSNYWLYAEGMADTAYYSQTGFYSTSGTNIDSASVKSISNSMLYRFNAVENKFIFYAGYKNEYSAYNQFSIDTTALNHIARAGLSFSGRDQLFSTHLQYVINGFNQDNYQAEALYRLKVARHFIFELRASAIRAMPSYTNKKFFTHHFTWDNHFTDISTENGTVSLSSTKYKFSIGAFAQHQQNPVYFDTLAKPQQYNGGTMLTRIFIQKDLRLWKIHFNNTVNYQTTANTDIIRLPSLLTFSQLYYEAKLFKNNLWLQVGVQARYISSFMSNAYMPATNQFYLQEKKEYGNYVFADVFLSAQIDRFRFFLLASHVNQGLTGGNYILCPNYPMPERSFKAGLSWMFFD